VFHGHFSLLQLVGSVSVTPERHVAFAVLYATTAKAYTAKRPTEPPLV
jgi:hypothetical protein